jgi:PAS domain S-box-containing protein
MISSAKEGRGIMPHIPEEMKRIFLFSPEEVNVLLKNLPLIVLAVDREGKVRYYNQRLEKYASFLGIPEGSLPENVATFFNTRPNWKEWLFEDPKSHETDLWLMGRLQKEDGPWLSVKWKVLLRQSDLVWLTGSVSTREMMTSQQLEDEDFYRKAFEASLNGIAIIDIEGNIITANKTALDIFRMPEISEEKKLNIFDLMTEETRNSIDFKGRFKEDGMVFNKIYEMIRPDGEQFFIEASTAAIHDEEGEPVYVVSTFRDITEELWQKKELEKALKKAEESDRLKTAFLTNMSHEIRTPMNAIVGFSGMLSNPNIPEEDKKEYIKYIELSSDTLLHLINDILDISKLESGQISINMEEFFVEDLLNELKAVAQELLNKYEKNHLDLRFEKKNIRECPMLRSDPHRIKQVLNNLIGNAIKFTEEGYVNVICSVEDDHLVFFIEDSGPGIPEEEQDTIFERFRQLDNSFTRKYGGAGLGLAITKNLVDNLKGEITLSSEAGRGTRFRVSFPGILHERRKKDAVAGPPEVKESPDWHDKTVLIAEDEKSSYDLLETMLMDTGIHILHAWSGQEAVEMCLQGERPDILLMDLRMPDLDGMIALKEIRNHFPGIPAIAQTAYAMADERRRCLESGFNDYLAKPVSLSMLIEKMSKILSE